MLCTCSFVDGVMFSNNGPHMARGTDNIDMGTMLKHIVNMSNVSVRGRHAV